MQISPFQYGTTVSQTAFTNRTKELNRLLDNFKNGINTILISPRRWGKSSLVEKAILRVKEEETNLKPVLIDLFTVSTEEDFLETFAREVIKASDQKLENWLANARELFQQLIPKFSFGIDPNNEFSISFDRKELKKNKEEVLNLPEVLGAKKGIKFIICLDEFQNLASFPSFESLEKKMRAVWQRQKSVNYCLFGSKHHMMQDLFNNSSKPFYRFGEIMLLSKIEEADWISFIVQNFEATKKKITPEIAAQIPKLMKNHSWYVQQLANYVWQLTSKTATQAIIDKALEEVVQTNIPLFQKEVELLTKTQLNLLRAIADGATQLTSVQVMKDYKTGTSGNVDKNKNILKNLDIIDESNKQFEFLDPVFEIWFKRLFG